MLRQIIAVTGRDRPSAAAFVVARYIADPSNIRCSIAEDGRGTSPLNGR